MEIMERYVWWPNDVDYLKCITGQCVLKKLIITVYILFFYIIFRENSVSMLSNALLESNIPHIFLRVLYFHLLQDEYFVVFSVDFHIAWKIFYDDVPSITIWTIQFVFFVLEAGSTTGRSASISNSIISYFMRDINRYVAAQYDPCDQVDQYCFLTLNIDVTCYCLFNMNYQGLA